MSKSPVTAAQLRSILADGHEDTTIARALLAFFQKHNGKTLTARMLPTLQAIAPDARITKRAGMTNLEWGGYGRTGGNQGGSFLIAYTEGAPVIDAAFIEERNAAYLSAADERNAKRRAVLADAPGEFGAFALAAEAINSLRRSREVIETLIGYDGPLYEARSEITKLLKED